MPGRIQAKYTVHIFIILLEEHNVVLTWECEEDEWALQYLSIGSPMMEKTGNGEYLRRISCTQTFKRIIGMIHLENMLCVLIRLENIFVTKFCSDFGLLLENISKINCAQNFKVISALLCNIVLSWFEWIMLGLKMLLKAYQSSYKSSKRPSIRKEHCWSLKKMARARGASPTF